MLQAWKDHFLAMTGKNFADIFEEDRLPSVLLRLNQKHCSVTNELEALPVLPNEREGTVRVQLLH